MKIKTKLLSTLLISLGFTTISNAQFGFEKIDSVEVIKGVETLKFPWEGAFSHAQFSNIDANFDGIDDLYVFDRRDNSSHIFIRNNTVGDINFTKVDSIASVFPKMNYWTILRDYNCDGKMDIFTSTSGGFAVYRNDGNSTDGLVFTKVSDQVRAIVFGGNSNLYVSSADLPAIEDIDNDGDLDVLTFDVVGTTVYYYRNNSVENYGVCDSLDSYELMNECWGLFREGNADNSISLNQSSYPCDNPNIPSPELPVNDDFTVKSQNRHSGSTLLALDYDNSGVFDLVLGDISFPNLVYVENGGITPNTNSSMTSFDMNFPSNTTPLDLNIFPAAFYVDVTNDGNRDLLVSTNSTVSAADLNSIWYYENIGTDALPNFTYKSNAFLQEEMIDVGSRAFPVFFDNNSDGLQDLIIGNYRYYDEVTLSYKTKIHYYENIGTVNQPKFKYITNDYQNISFDGLFGYNIPTFGDLDNDGDEDMILGESTGHVHYYENTAGAGNPANFNLTTNTMLDDQSNPISSSTYSAPKLIDLNRDGLLDLVLGRKDGKLSYYENVGTLNTPSFRLITDNLGGVNTSEYNDIVGYSVPEFVDIDGEYHLFLGSKKGGLYYYNDIEGNLGGNFNLVDSIALGIKPGEYTGVGIGNLYTDTTIYTMVIGNSRGGLTLYQNNDTSVNIGIKEVELGKTISLYPNPAKNIITLQSDNQLKKYTIYSITGQLQKQERISSNTVTIDLSNMANGIYIIKCIDIDDSVNVLKFIKE